LEVSLEVLRFAKRLTRDLPQEATRDHFVAVLLNRNPVLHDAPAS
jgi:hypothetical protein